MAKIKICKEKNCHNAATTSGYCRLHYLKNWKKIRHNEKERAAKKLNAYVEHVIKKYPDRYMEIIKKDIRSQQFEKSADDKFGYDEAEVDRIFNEPTYDEEIEQLLKDLKIEKDYK